MKKSELFEEYQAMLVVGKQPDLIILYIHMPNSNNPEIILNYDVADKMAYIDKTYDDDLVHSGCKDIYITEVFLRTFDQNITFGDAIEAMKYGKKVARAGWNGKSQHIELASNISYCSPEGRIVNCEHVAIGNQAIAFVGTSGVQMGWLASQSDMLADDWYILPETEDEDNA